MNLESHHSNNDNQEPYKQPENIKFTPEQEKQR
jgi:hypothetical protein